MGDNWLFPRDDRVRFPHYVNEARFNVEQANRVLRQYHFNRRVRGMAAGLAIRSAFVAVTGIVGYSARAIAKMVYNKAQMAEKHDPEIKKIAEPTPTMRGNHFSIYYVVATSQRIRRMGRRT